MNNLFNYVEKYLETSSLGSLVNVDVPEGSLQMKNNQEAFLFNRVYPLMFGMQLKTSAQWTINFCY